MDNGSFGTEGSWKGEENEHSLGSGKSFEKKCLQFFEICITVCACLLVDNNGRYQTVRFLRSVAFPSTL